MHLADVPAAAKHLQTAVQLCHEAARGAIPDANFTQSAKAALVVPCAAQGMLHAAQQHLAGGAGTSGASAWASAQLEAAPAFLGLLVAVVTLQPALLEKVTWGGFAISCCDAGCRPAAHAVGWLLLHSPLHSTSSLRSYPNATLLLSWLAAI